MSLEMISPWTHTHTHTQTHTQNPYQKHFLAKGRENEFSDMVSTSLNRQQQGDRRHRFEQSYHRNVELTPPRVSCTDAALTPVRPQANWRLANGWSCSQFLQCIIYPIIMPIS